MAMHRSKHDIFTPEELEEIRRADEELEADVEVLRKNIAMAREDLEKVQTIDEAKAFGENHDLEVGLNHIQLF